MNSNNVSTTLGIHGIDEIQIPVHTNTISDINEYLVELAVPDPDARRTALCNILTRNGLDYTVQKVEPTEEKPRGIENYLIEIGQATAPHLLFCAHYDSYPASCGANDNSAAVCILIKLAMELKKQGNIVAEFAFFDGEESKHLGSKLYVENFDKNRISAVINLDMCGYGDTIVAYSHGSITKTPIRNFCDKSNLSRNNGQLVKYLPESDNIAFSGTHLPILNLAIMPKWDVPYLRALATYDNNILGKPPEFDMILGQMEIFTTMHGGFRDNISSVQPSAMQQVFDYLYESITLPIPKKKWFELR